MIPETAHSSIPRLCRFPQHLGDPCRRPPDLSLLPPRLRQALLHRRSEQSIKNLAPLLPIPINLALLVPLAHPEQVQTGVLSRPRGPDMALRAAEREGVFHAPPIARRGILVLQQAEMQEGFERIQRLDQHLSLLAQSPSAQARRRLVAGAPAIPLGTANLHERIVLPSQHAQERAQSLYPSAGAAHELEPTGTHGPGEKVKASAADVGGEMGHCRSGIQDDLIRTVSRLGCGQCVEKLDQLHSELGVGVETERQDLGQDCGGGVGEDGSAGLRADGERGNGVGQVG
jgi:hypothetical protein